MRLQLTVCMASVCSAVTAYCQIPRTWGDAAIASHEIPLADPAGSPKHLSSDYYYRIPVRPIFKGYPVYAPGREPAGYMEWLKHREPIIVWDDKGHAPLLETDADWIRAGEIVFDAPIAFDSIAQVADLRNPEWYEKLHVPVARDGTVPEFQYVIRTKGVVEVGAVACATCHTRVMPDGSVLKGAQGNFPVNALPRGLFVQGLRPLRIKTSTLSSCVGASSSFMLRRGFIQIWRLGSIGCRSRRSLRFSRPPLRARTCANAAIRSFRFRYLISST